jgi:hypothetical protein
MKRLILMIAIMLVSGIKPLLANVEASVLTFNAWKFNYSYAPATVEVLSRATSDKFTMIKFNPDKSFVLVSEEKVESGLWDVVTLDGKPAIKFNFDNYEFWGIKSLDKDLFIINQKLNGRMVEYYFSPASSEKDLRLFGNKLNAHIQEMENFYRSLAINNGVQNNANLNTIEKIKQLDGIPANAESKIITTQEIETMTSKLGFFKRIFGKSKSLENVSTPSKIVNNTNPSILTTSVNPEFESVTSEDANTVNIRNIKYSFKAHKTDYIEIFVSGGGLQAGINPKLRDQIIFHNSGLVQKEYESKLGGKVSTQKKISREELLELATFIMNQGFFSLEKEYACGEDDEVCKDRILMGPKPIPLNMVIVVGQYRHNVSIPVYAPDRYKDIGNYPESITNILNTIYRYASL